MIIDEKYMHRCLQLAEKGAGCVSPNPMVGAVVVHDGKIIGEGYHKRFGEAHAEVNAIDSVKDKMLLPKSTVYVSLEPCSHYGKTPPCAKLLISYKIPRVVVASVDPNPKVSGRGIEMMRNAGVNVITGVLEKEADELNRIFIINQKLQRPYVILKWAQSADGFIDYNRVPGDGKSPAKFSNELSAVEVHKLRTQTDAIMVGTNTALLDDPRLNSRLWYGKNPVRVVIDKDGRLSEKQLIFNDDAETIVFTKGEYPVKKEHVTPVVIKFEQESNKLMLQKLIEMNISSLLVEGGTQLLNTFIQNNLWDEAYVEVSPQSIINGVKAPHIDYSVAPYKKYQDTIRYHLKNKITQNII